MIFQQLSYFDVGSVIIGVILFVAACYGVRLLFLIVNTNRKIEYYHEKRDREIEEATNRPGLTIDVVNTKKNHLNEKYQKLIDPLLRKKNYIFDIIPFIPKK